MALLEGFNDLLPHPAVFSSLGRQAVDWQERRAKPGEGLAMQLLPAPAPSLWFGKAARLRHPRPLAGELLSSLTAWSLGTRPVLAARALGGLGRPASPPPLLWPGSSGLPALPLISCCSALAKWPVAGVGAKPLPPPSYKPRRLDTYLLRRFLSQPLFYLSCLFPC